MAVRIAFPWNHYARSGEAVSGYDRGKIRTIRMSIQRRRSGDRFCNACGARIPAGTDFYAPDYPGDDSTAIDADCDVARTVRSLNRERPLPTSTGDAITTHPTGGQ